MDPIEQARAYIEAQQGERSGSVRVCPHCRRPGLQRRHLPFYLRPLRLVGFNLRAYSCLHCSRQVIRRERR